MINIINRSGSFLISVFLFCAMFYFLTDVAHFRLLDPYQYNGDALETYSEYGRAYIFNDFSARSFTPFETTQNNSWAYAINLCFQMDANLKILCYWLTGDVIAAVNIYFLLTFLLAFITSYYVLDKLRLQNPYKFATAALYALMPYHFLRGIAHSYESSYFLTPLLVLILLWIWSARPLFSAWRQNHWVFSCRDKRTVFTLIVVIFLSSFHLYHQFFFAILASASALLAGAYRRSWRHFFSGLSVAFIAVGVLLIKKNLTHITTLPSLQLAFGGAPVASYGDSEVYPLKIAQMLLPLPQHHWGFLASIRQLYDSAHPLINENSTVTLGLAGAIGFVVAIAAALTPGRRHLSVTAKLGLLTLTCLLFASMGGFSSLLSTFSYHAFGPTFELSQTRGWNRIVIFIGFFSYYIFFVTVRSVVRWVHDRFFYMLPQNASHFPVSLLTLGIALWDQVPFKLTTPPSVIDTYHSDKDFFSSVQNQLLPGSRIFQMPLMISRASGYINGVYATDGLRPYLASENLKFMYGGDSLSYQVQWWRSMIELPPKMQILKLCEYGFSGALIHRSMYTDPTNVEKKFVDILQIQPQKSRLLDFSFFPIADYCKSNSLHVIDLAAEEHRLLGSVINPYAAVRFFSADMFYRQIGHLSLDPENDFIATSGKEEKGYLAYVPNVSLIPGKYLAEFHIKIDNPVAPDAVIFDVAESSPTQPLHQISVQSLPEGIQKQTTATLAFDVVSSSNKYQFRVLDNGVESMQFSGLHIKRLTAPSQ